MKTVYCNVKKHPGTGGSLKKNYATQVRDNLISMHRLSHRITLHFLIAIMAMGPTLPIKSAHAQVDATEPQTESVEDNELIGSEQTIEVESPTADADIADRLQRILDATNRFTSPQVTVQDGVVFLAGTVRDENNRTWAGDLARKTQGVVAVVNNIEVTEGPLWTLDPAVKEVRSLWRQIIQAAPLLVIGLVVFVITIIIGRMIARSTMKQFRNRIDSELVRNVLEKIIILLIALVGFFLFLRISGLTSIAVTLAGGTGLLGLIVGFAFRDIAENFLASVLISVQRPFRIGDTIEVDGHTGVVQKVTTRGTVLMDFDGNHIQIANSTIYKNTIRNLTANPKIRLNFTVGIGYDSSIELAQQVARGVLNAHSAVLNDPEPSILVEELGASSITLHIYFWIDGHEYSMLKVRSSLMRKVLKAYETAGISMPDDAREVIFPQAVPIRMLTDEKTGSEAKEPPTVRPSDTMATAAEPLTEPLDDLSSEVEDLQRQAKESRSPEEGADIMRNDSDSQKATK